MAISLSRTAHGWTLRVPAGTAGQNGGMRLRRCAAAAIGLLVLAPMLVACGDDGADLELGARLHRAAAVSRDRTQRATSGAPG